MNKTTTVFVFEDHAVATTRRAATFASTSLFRFYDLSMLTMLPSLEATNKKCSRCLGSTLIYVDLHGSTITNLSLSQPISAYLSLSQPISAYLSLSPIKLTKIHRAPPRCQRSLWTPRFGKPTATIQLIRLVRSSTTYNSLKTCLRIPTLFKTMLLQYP